MTRYLSILLSCVLVTSCNQQPSQVERDYIKNLEEKNRLLEEELRKERNKSKGSGTSNASKQSTQMEAKKMPGRSNGYFTIGSTEDEVIAVMGDPTSYQDIGMGKTFFYGGSIVYFEDGKVTGYSNAGKNLKVKVKI